MDGGDTLEARLPRRDNVVLDVRYYCCVYVVHFLYSMIVTMVMCTCNIFSIAYI